MDRLSEVISTVAWEWVAQPAQKAPERSYAQGFETPPHYGAL